LPCVAVPENGFLGIQWFGMTAPALPPTRELFERYGAMVYRRCFQILKRPEDAADAVQEVFLRVHARRESYRGDASPSSWLYGAATLHCLQSLRNRLARDAKLAGFQLAETPTISPLEDKLALLEIVARLPEDDGVMAHLRFVDGLTLEEVAEVVGRSRKTVANRLENFLSQARMQLDTTSEAP
jgi:RNA polymerase sigma-70 factor (ECF subfamily)